MGDQWRNIRKAKLNIHLPKAPSEDDIDTWIYLSYVEVSKANQASLRQSKAVRTKLNLRRGGWVDLDVSEILEIWLKYGEENFGLVLDVKTKTGLRLPIGVQHQRTNVRLIKNRSLDF